MQFLDITLRPFQVECVEKLARQKSRLIGDDMGLGKTVEALALDLVNRADPTGREGYSKPITLIVAPLATHEDAWADKLELMAPEAATFMVIDPKNRSKFIDSIKRHECDYYIVHWEALRLMPELEKVVFFHIIADEAHRAKNRKAQQTRALKKLKTRYKTACSGTPADNKPHDLWSIMNWLWPSYYRSYWKFYNHYMTFEVQYPQGYHKITGVKNIASLLNEMSPWYIRRLKEDMLPELPDKYYTRLMVELAPQQRTAYNKMKKDLIAWVGEHEDQPLVAPVVIAQLCRLQQFALSYTQFDDSGNLIASDPSAKLDALMDLLDDSDEPIVVFSQFKGILELFAKRLDKAKISYRVYTGDAQVKKTRDQGIKDFQKGDARVFMATIAAGGEGITLTRASTVVFLDRSWSPAKNKQAEDRLHRIGQENAVQVIDIIAKNTVDLGRMQTIKQKWEWIQQLLGDTTELQLKKGEPTDG